VFQPSRSF